LRARLLGLFVRLGRFARKLKSLATIAKDFVRELKCVARKAFRFIRAAWQACAQAKKPSDDGKRQHARA
jgi:hypothetical protein